MSTILDALKRVEEQLRKDARQRGAEDSAITSKGVSPGENDEGTKVYLALMDMLTRIQDRVRVVADEERAEAKRANEELAQALAALESDFACRLEVLQEEIRQRDPEQEAGRAALATEQARLDSLKQALDEIRQSLAGLVQAMAGLENDLARQREALHEGAQQRVADREAGKAALTEAMAAFQKDLACQGKAFQKEVRQRDEERQAARDQAKSVKRGLEEASIANDELAQAMAALRDDFGCLREAFNEESRQRSADGETEKATLAETQARVDALKQVLTEISGANTDLLQPLAALQNDCASQRETLQKEGLQREEERKAAQSQFDSIKEVLAESRRADADLMQTLATLQNDFGGLREALDEERRQRRAESEAGMAGLADAQTQIDSLNQILTEAGGASAQLAQRVAALQSDVLLQADAIHKEVEQREADDNTRTSALTEAQTRIDSLERSLAEAGGANAQLAQTVAALQSDVLLQADAIHKEVEQREADDNKGTSALTEAQTRIDSLERSLAEAGGANAQLAQTVAALQSDVLLQADAIHKEVEQREADDGKGTSALTEAQARIDSLERSLAEAGGANAQLAQTMAILQADVALQKTTLQKESQQRGADREDGKAALAEALSQIDSLKQLIAEISRGNAEMLQPMSVLQGDFASIKEALAEVIRQREEDRETARAQVDSLTQSLRDVSGANAQFAQTLAELQNALMRQKEVVEKERQERQAGKAGLDEALSQVDSLKQAMAEISRGKAELLQPPESLEDEVSRRRESALQNDVASLRDTLEKEVQQREKEQDAGKALLAEAQAQVEALRQMLSETGSANSELLQTMAALRNDLASQRDALQEEIARRNEEREAGNTAVAETQAQVDALRQIIAEHEVAIADAQERASRGRDDAAGASAPVQDEWFPAPGQEVRETAEGVSETRPVKTIDKHEALRLHKAAVEAYTNGNASEALHLLDTIDAAFPNNKSVLYNRAECLASLGRTDEARRLCDYLVLTFSHEAAGELRGRLN